MQLDLFTVLAYDDHQNGVPIAWALLEKHKSEHLILFLQSLKKRVEERRANLLLEPEWKPIAFLIDVACEEILSIGYFRNPFIPCCAANSIRAKFMSMHVHDFPKGS